jgi:HPt (histidine-containing phosphotransfer) domain-containing protein
VATRLIGEFEENTGMGASRKSVDPEVLDALARLEHDGRAGFVTRIISLFFENAQAQIGEIKAAAAAHELSKVRQASHQLRASSAAVGAVRLAELCNQLAGMAEPARSRAWPGGSRCSNRNISK